MEIYRHLLLHSLRSDVGILGAVDSGGGRATMVVNYTVARRFCQLRHPGTTSGMLCNVSHQLQYGNWQALRLFPQSGLRLLWLLFGPMLIVFCFLVVFPVLRAKGAPIRGTGTSECSRSCGA